MALADEMIKTLMKKLDCDEETAKDILESDRRIDKGEKLFELSADQKKAEKKMRAVGVKTVNPYGKQTTRERPQDEEKRFLIETLELALSPFAENVETTNPEREIIFKYKNRKFKIVLSAPRS